MTSFHDAYPELPLLVDVGGERYYLGPERPVELAYKGRAEFLKAFPTKNAAKFTPEYLVRQHLPVDRQPDTVQHAFRFTYPGEKDAFISLLEQRIQQLKQSSEFTGSVLKNTMLQRVSLQLQEILMKLRGAHNDTAKNGNNANNKHANQRNTPKKVSQNAPTPSLSEDQYLQLLLELVWYLLHPEKVPSGLQSEWSTMLKELNTLRLGDIMAQIRTLQQNKGAHSAIRPRNFFTNKGLNGNTKGGANTNALDKAIEFSTHVDDTVAREETEKRVKALLHILQAKKYLNNSFQFDESFLNVMDISSTLPSVQQSLLRNVVQDDKNKRLDKPLTGALAPLFDYFASMFDPVYGFLHSGISAYLDKMDYVTRPHLIPHLLTLLHVFQHIHPTEEGEGGQAMYGIYELTDTDPELVAFISALLTHTRGQVEQMGDDEQAKGTFQKQLTSLPNVRLSFASRSRGLLPNASEASKVIPYMSLLMVGQNLTVPSLDNYMRERKLSETLHEEMENFFQPDRLYLTIAKSESHPVPVNLHRVDMREVTVETDPLPIKRVTFQDKNDVTVIKNKELSLGDIVDVDSYVICNDAEILLSLLIAFQERIPK